jgi:AcrR family transcriptional regulator
MTVQYGQNCATMPVLPREVKESPYRMVKVMTTPPPRTCARDQRRETILAVAREVFFEQGYTAASMSTIAARLGGSKGTLYNYFKSKEELFEAQVRNMCGAAADRILEVAAEGEPVETLTRLGEQYLQHLFSQETVQMFRILVAEAQRSPELARVFYEVGPARGQKGLESYLGAAKARGLIDLPDCALAAEQFLSLCKGRTHLQFLLNLIPPLSSDAIRLQTAQAVKAFMTLYGAKPRG